MRDGYPKHNWEKHPQQAFAIRHVCQRCGMLRTTKRYPGRKSYPSIERVRITTSYYQNGEFVAENPLVVPICRNLMLEQIE